MVHFTVDFGIGAGVGFVVGAFTPAVGRAIKAAFVKFATKVVATAKTDAAAAVTAVEKKV